MGGGPDAAPHRHVKRPLLHVLRQETADKGVAGPVGVHNLVRRQPLGGELKHLAVLDADDRVGALGDDDEPAPRSVLLGKHGDALGNLSDVAGLQAVDLGVGGGLCLIAEDHVGVGHDGHHLVLEELDEEGSGEVEAVGLVIGSAVLSNLQFKD